MALPGVPLLVRALPANGAQEGLDPARADVARAVPGVAEARDLHGAARTRCVDEPTAAEVDTDVPEEVEEDEVTGAEVGPRDRAPAAVLHGGVVRERDADLAVQKEDEA